MSEITAFRPTILRIHGKTNEQVTNYIYTDSSRSEVKTTKVNKKKKKKR